MNNKPSLYLASGSPRRRELLHGLGFELIRLSADIDETPTLNEAADAYVLRMARQKNAVALAQWQAQHSGAPAYPVLSADTTVALGNHILGKPENAAEARAMLRQLSGNTHQVLTAVCVSVAGQCFDVLQSSDVRFKTLSAAEIEAYIASGEPMDKAGAYGIQGLGGVFVAHLSGSFTGVMGLPVYETMQLLQQCGVAVPPFQAA